MRAITAVLVSLVSLGATGCHQVASKNIPTENMEADIKVVVNGDNVASVSASLKLRDEAFAYVDLSPGESIFVDAGGDRRAMSDVGFSYALTMPLLQHSQSMQVSIERAYYASAFDSFVTLPQPFELFVTQEPSASGSDMIYVEWDQLSDDPMKVTLDGPCLFEHTAYIDSFQDDGVYVVSAGSLDLHRSWDGGSCPVSITVERSRSGVVDSRLSGGTIEAVQERRETMLIYR